VTPKPHLFRDRTPMPVEGATNPAARGRRCSGLIVQMGAVLLIRAIAVAGLLLCSSAAFGQPAAPRPQFEVASIKPSAPGQPGTFIRTAPGGRFNINNMSLKEMIVMAWRIQPFQISGGPGWMDSAHYDISAKPEDNAKRSDVPLMLQSLLADRFQLMTHRETKELPIYALVVANKDGKLGPRLTASKEGSCTPPDPTKAPPLPEPGKPQTLGCGGMMMGPDRVAGGSIPLTDLIPMLSRILGRTVVDKTGLTGKFDISMEWTPDESQAVQFAPGGLRPPPSDTTGPSIITALQEQLGLKLESQKGPVEMFVIDHVERPSEN
jgi:uncharacterized protein (TIGR03435 family)